LYKCATQRKSKVTPKAWSKKLTLDH